MKFLLYGITRRILPLLRIIESSTEARVLGWFDSDSVHSDLRELFSAGRQIGDAKNSSVPP